MDSLYSLGIFHDLETSIPYLRTLCVLSGIAHRESGGYRGYRESKSWRGHTSGKIAREYREDREYTRWWESGEWTLCANERSTHGGRRMNATRPARPALPR